MARRYIEFEAPTAALTPDERLKRAAAWAVVASVVFWPIAAVAFLLGWKLVSVQRVTAGAWVMSLAAFVGFIGLAATGAVWAA